MTERERFEAWAASKGMNIRRLPAGHIDESGDYLTYYTAECWVC